MKHYFLTGEAGHQDKLSDPALQMEPVNVYGKNILNGCVPQNGFLQNSKMNITNNPLAETDEDKVSQTTIFKLLFYFLNSHHSSSNSPDNLPLPISICTKSHQLPFNSCWNVYVLHNLLPNTNHMTCYHLELAYQFVPSSRHSFDISLR